MRYLQDHAGDLTGASVPAAWERCRADLAFAVTESNIRSAAKVAGVDLSSRRRAPLPPADLEEKVEVLAEAHATLAGYVVRLALRLGEEPPEALF